MLFALSALTVHWFSSLFMHSFFLHRYCAHRMFDLSPFWEKFFYLLTYLTQGASFLNPRSYSIMHQLHHQFSDHPGDPHSPQQHPTPWHMMWQTYRTYQHYRSAPVQIPNHQVVHHYPTWPALDRFARQWWSNLAWVLLYILCYLIFTDSLWFLLLVPIHALMGPIQGALVNWFGHYWGYRNFNLSDHSRNTLWVDLLLMGEWYQNNHHAKALSSNFAYRWFELDLTYVGMLLLKKLGIIRLRQD